MLPSAFSNGAFIGQHGSWNRSPRSGYKVIFVPFSQRTSGSSVGALTGFVKDDRALGHPVGVALDREGALVAADDVGNRIWRVTGNGPSPTAAAGAPQTAAVPAK